LRVAWVGGWPSGSDCMALFDWLIGSGQRRNQNQTTETLCGSPDLVAETYAITLWEPWATLIAIGAKKFETRSWAPPAELKGKRLAIHAAKRWTSRQKEWAERFAALPGQEDLFAEELQKWRYQQVRWKPPTLGHVLCTVTLAAWWTVWPESELWNDTLERVRPASIRDAQLAEFAFGDFRRGRFAWELTRCVKTAQTPASGQQGIWIWDEENERRQTEDV